jgi:hypothetical protein
LDLDEDVCVEKLGKKQYGKLCEKFRNARKNNMCIEDRVNLMLLERENKLILREILKRATNNEKVGKELKECTFSPIKYANYVPTGIERYNEDTCMNLKFEDRQREFNKKKYTKLDK